ncbi:hypothetical protein AAEX37_01953 [Oligella sp. MSHR50489EDL]|uniref:hypothetical protein n=1 Tax=Oligella sp. MSHR50489EDL TaxID=3139409 RepID=UPI003D817E8D
MAAIAITEGLATYVELDTVLGLEDLLNILEVHHVHTYNKQLVDKYVNKRN